MKHEAAHGQIDNGFGDLGLAFVAAAQTAGTPQPAEGAFDREVGQFREHSAVKAGRARDIMLMPSNSDRPVRTAS